MMNLAGQDPANPGYESLAINGFNMDIAGVKVDMPKLVSAVGRSKKDSVVAVKTEPFKVSLTTDEGKYGEQLAGQLAMLGYETLELTGAGYQTYDPETDLTTYAQGENYWALKDGFRIDFGAKFAGAKAMAEAGQSDDPTAALGDTLENMVLHNMELVLDDDGFMDRAFNAYAAQSGQDPQELRNQVTGMLAMAPDDGRRQRHRPGTADRGLHGAVQLRVRSEDADHQARPGRAAGDAVGRRNGRPVGADQSQARLLGRQRIGVRPISKGARIHLGARAFLFGGPGA